MDMFPWVDKLQITWREIIDIAVVTFVFYRALLLIKGTRALSVMHGFFLILIVYYLSGEFGLVTLHWLLTNFLGSVFLVIIILFKSDIRKALSRMGAGSFWFRSTHASQTEDMLNEMVLAVFKLARTRTGALIVFERNVPLGDIIQRGVDLSASISKELLLTVFNTETPLHDGAVVVQGGTIAAAGCILPLAAGVNIDPTYGTRHRAALGVTEDTDALAVVVSEERGQVQTAERGELSGPLDEISLKNKLCEQWSKCI